MADTITLNTLQNTDRKLVVQVDYISDGVGSTDAVVVDKSTFLGPDKTEPGRFVVEKIEFAVDGVQLHVEFEHGTDALIGILTGQGVLDFYQDGKYQGFVDPATDGTGDIVITSVGHTAGDAASFTLYLRKKD